MNTRFSRPSMVVLCLMLLQVVSAFRATAQHSVSVDVAKIINDVSRKPIGINVNHLMDDKYIYPAPTISTTDALRGMGAKFMRYPGGEKADNYLWSVAPFTSSNPRWARTSYNDWPTGDTRFGNTDWKTPKASCLDFDEFMTMCRAAGGTPVIVVAYDGMLKAAGPGGTIPTKEQLLKTAEEWVRYANKVKGYNIKYWMIGNESYKTDAYNGFATAAQYRDHVIEFSKRMKAIDPTIKIIANGDGNSWWSTVLPSAAAHIDFIGISNYPVWNFSGGYTYYKNSSPDFVGGVRNAVNAINTYAPSTERSRIKVITTEFNSNDWSGAWVDNNDLGHALAAFEILGQHLNHSRVEAALMWNTRWIDNVTKPNHIYDALKKTGHQNANGMAFAIWGNSLLSKMVSTTSTTKVRTYASYDPLTRKLNVYLVNKETTAQTANLSLANYVQGASIVKKVMKGAGPTDVNPTWTTAGTQTLAGSSLSLSLPAVSITMLSFTPSTSTLARFDPANAVYTEKIVKLDWRTAGTGSETVVVERSADGVAFTAIGTMKAGEDNDHTYNDTNPLKGMNHYRLRLTDAEGNVTYSDVLSVLADVANGLVKLFPNPANDFIKIDYNAVGHESVELEAFAVDGKLIYRHTHPVDEEGRILLDAGTWPKGMYFLRLRIGEESFTEKVVLR